jgi:hypothetical protein
MYGFSKGLGRHRSIEFRENRPILNLLMLKFFLREIRNHGNSSDLCGFFIEPKIVFDSYGTPFQVMEYVDTSVKIFNRNLPRNSDMLKNLVLNICNAACLANVTFQCDCSPCNLCFTVNDHGDACDIRMFDCDIMDSGDDKDAEALLDFTNLKNFNAAKSAFQGLTALGCFDSRAALPPIISRDLYDALGGAIESLRKIACGFSSEQPVEVPFMLKDGGLLSQWMGRVMVLGVDGMLYKSAISNESTAFDEAAALFVLHKLKCSNSELRNLFMNLSFPNLKKRYDSACSAKREAELVAFFKHFMP